MALRFDSMRVILLLLPALVIIVGTKDLKLVRVLQVLDYSPSLACDLLDRDHLIGIALTLKITLKIFASEVECVAPAL